MRVNSAQRLLKRRKVALENRQANVKDWSEKLAKDPENKGVKEKLEKAQSEVAALTKKVGKS